MSPTTLYREGTDLDELLAELDEQYPGQVQVLEITHPREGGVLGFFAKQRVGVHYRLADALPETDPFMTALAAARGRAEMADAMPAGAVTAGAGSSMTGRGPHTGGSSGGDFGGRSGDNRGNSLGGGLDGVLDVLSDADVPAGVAAAAAAIALDVTAASREVGAAQAVSDDALVTARAARPSTSLGPDPETLAAALAGRAGATAPAATFDGRTAAISPAGAKPTAAVGRVGAAFGGTDARAAGSPGGAPAPVGRDTDDQDPLARLGRAVDAAAQTAARGGVADPFAAMLAAIALRRPIADRTTVETPPAPATSHAGAPASANARSARDTAFTDGMSALAEGRAPAAAPPAVPAARAAAPSQAAARAAALYEQRTPQIPAYAPADLIGTDFAAAGFEVASPTAERDPAPLADDEPPLMTWATVDRAGLEQGCQQPAPPTQEAAASRTAPAAPATGTERRTDSLAWPIAQSTAAQTPPAEGPKIVLRRGNRGGQAVRTAVPDGAASGADRAQSSPEPGRTLLLSRQATALSDDEPTARRPSSHSDAQRATSLTLRRQLLEVGVPVDRVPGDAVHVYAAIEQLVQALPPAPVAPSRPGEILVVVGAARDVVAAADSLLTATHTPFESIWTFGCPAASGTRRIPVGGETVLTEVEQACTIAAEARAERTGPLLIVIATDTTAGRERAADVIAAVSPDAVWAAVDATRKPADARRALAPAGQLDGMIVTHAERSSSPATVWELDLPIALVDGRASTGPVWAVLLLDKVGELTREEGAACSGARC